MRKAILSVCLLPLVVSACAKPPDQIVATPVPEVIYEGKTCPQLRLEKAESGLALATLSSQQSSAVTGDTVGVLMLGLPLSSMAGNDVSGKIAEAKGRIASMEAVMARKRCDRVS